MELFRDTFEGTDFDMTKNLTIVDDAGKTVKSPLANPFMPYDMNKMLKLNGGWGWYGRALPGPLVLHVRHGDAVARLAAGPGGRRGLARLRQSGHDHLRADLCRRQRSTGRIQDRRPHDGLQPSLGVVGVPPGGHDLGPSLGRHAPRRFRRPRPAARAVPQRAKSRRRESVRTLEERPRQGPRLSHRNDLRRLPPSHRRPIGTSAATSGTSTTSCGKRSGTRRVPSASLPRCTFRPKAHGTRSLPATVTAATARSRPHTAGRPPRSRTAAIPGR